MAAPASEAEVAVVDAYIDKLVQCKHLTETEVQDMCAKVSHISS